MQHQAVAARTRDLDAPVDLLHVAGEHGTVFETAEWGLAGLGEAVRLEVPFVPSELGAALTPVRDALASVRRPSEARPVAFVAVPFTNSRPVLAIIPEICVMRSGEEASVTTVGDHEPFTHFDGPAHIESPSSYRVTSRRSPKQWQLAVEEAVRRLLDGELQKVVLAREIAVDADAPFSQVSTLRQLRRSYPTAYRFAIDGFLGASPELLIEREGGEVRSKPLAGTLPRSSDPVADSMTRTALLHSGKDRSEHRFLSDMMRETLTPFCSELTLPPAPEIMSLANVHHLATPVLGTLSNPDTSVLDLVAALHPTPAVAGRPTERAVELIAELEELDRGRYAGAVGWVDADGNGSFAVAIRCAQLNGAHARVYAGCGIVAASNPERELDETQWKLQAMLSALVLP